MYCSRSQWQPRQAGLMIASGGHCMCGLAGRRGCLNNHVAITHYKRPHHKMTQDWSALDSVLSPGASDGDITVDWDWNKNKANLRDLIAASGLANLLKFDSNHLFFILYDLEIIWMIKNKANLRDLIAATGLVILLKLDLNRWFFSPCDLEIWWMTPKNNRAPLLCYFKLFASFRSH